MKLFCMLKMLLSTLGSNCSLAYTNLRDSQLATCFGGINDLLAVIADKHKTHLITGMQLSGISNQKLFKASVQVSVHNWIF